MRLSSAPSTTAVPVRGSATAWSSTTLVPRVRFASTMPRGGCTRTNGRPANAAARQSVREPVVTPWPSVAYAVVTTAQDDGCREASGIRDELRARQRFAQELGQAVHRLVEPGRSGMLEPIPDR